MAYGGPIGGHRHSILLNIYPCKNDKKIPEIFLFKVRFKQDPV